MHSLPHLLIYPLSQLTTLYYLVRMPAGSLHLSVTPLPSPAFSLFKDITHEMFIMCVCMQALSLHLKHSLSLSLALPIPPSIDIPHEMPITPSYACRYSPIGNSVGARIEVHEGDHAPQPDINGLDIPPGASTSLSMRSEVTIKESHPFGNCTTRYVHLISLITDRIESHYGEIINNRANGLKPIMATCKNKMYKVNAISICVCSLCVGGLSDVRENDRSMRKRER